MDSIVISEDCVSRSKSKLICCGCCPVRNSSSTISYKGKTDEDFEYIVEKLIIKRVPARRSHQENPQLKKAVFNPLTEPNPNNPKMKPIVLSSYCQIAPENLSFKKPKENHSNILMGNHPLFQISPENFNFKQPKDIPNGASGDAEAPVVVEPPSNTSPNFATSGRRKQLHDCGLMSLSIPKVHSNLSPSVSKPHSLFEERPSSLKKQEVDPAVEEILKVLSSKVEKSNRRVIDNHKINLDRDSEEPLRLTDVYQTANCSPELPIKLDPPTKLAVEKNDKPIGKSDGEGKCKEIKWKIVIKPNKPLSKL